MCLDEVDTSEQGDGSVPQVIQLAVSVFEAYDISVQDGEFILSLVPYNGLLSTHRNDITDN